MAQVLILVTKEVKDERERWVFSDFAAVKAIIKSWPVFILEIEDPNEDDSNSSEDDEESNVEV